MSHQKTHSANSEVLNPLNLEYALLAPDVVAWRFDVDSGALTFSKEFPLVFNGGQDPFTHLSALMDVLPSADKYIFLQTFNSDPNDSNEGVRACEVKCFSGLNEHRVRFIGRLIFTKKIVTMKEWWYPLRIGWLTPAAKPATAYCVLFLPKTLSPV